MTTAVRALARSGLPVPEPAAEEGARGAASRSEGPTDSPELVSVTSRGEEFTDEVSSDEAGPSAASGGEVVVDYF